MIKNDALTEAAGKLTRAYERRFGKEALGAYRAGYNYLLVTRPRTNAPQKPGELDFSIRAAFIPMRHEPPEGFDFGDVIAELYDLSALEDGGTYEHFMYELGRLK